MKKSTAKSRFFLYFYFATNSLTLIQLQQISCYCSSKTRKSESNSQLLILCLWFSNSCYCSSKTRKSESNSQLTPWYFVPFFVVIALVKLENLKAIHNGIFSWQTKKHVVIALVKLENLKAIHNWRSLA